MISFETSFSSKKIGTCLLFCGKKAKEGKIAISSNNSSCSFFSILYSPIIRFLNFLPIKNHNFDFFLITNKF